MEKILVEEDLVVATLFEGYSYNNDYYENIWSKTKENHKGIFLQFLNILQVDWKFAICFHVFLSSIYSGNIYYGLKIGLFERKR